jgi:hypothetical protein
MLNENRESLSIPGFYVKDPQLGVRFLALLRINKDISKSKGRGPKVQILNSETRNYIETSFTLRCWDDDAKQAAGCKQGGQQPAGGLCSAEIVV